MADLRLPRVPLSSTSGLATRSYKKGGLWSYLEAGFRDSQAAATSGFAVSGQGVCVG